MASQFTYPYARFINTSPDRGRVSFYVNDKEYFKDFPFGEISGYRQIPSGDVTFRAVWENGGENVIYTLRTSIDNGDVYTIALAGEAGSRTLRSINDITDKTDYQASHIRFADLVSDFDGFNIYANGLPIIEDIEFPEVSSYIMVKPGEYSFKILNEDTDDVILDTGKQTLKPFKYYTLYVIGAAENQGEPVKVIFTTDAMSYDGQYL